MIIIARGRPLNAFSTRKDVVMDKISLASNDLTQIDPEVKAYVYQTIMEFQPFITPATTVSVILKDPLDLIKKYKDNVEELEKLPPTKELKNMWRIQISLVEDGAKMRAEGLSHDIFESIKIAKDLLVTQLEQIQNSVISSSERAIQLTTARQESEPLH